MAATVWALRSPGYKLGVLVFYLGSGFYLMGFVAPFWWFHKNSSVDKPSIGLWLWCVYRNCYPVNEVMDSWYIAVQTLESLGLVGLLVAGVYVVIVNCRKNSGTVSTHHRFLEVLVAGSALCGFVGCMVFVGKLPKVLRRSLEEKLSWAFSFSLAGSLLAAAASAVICCTHRAEPPCAGVVFIPADILNQEGNTRDEQQGQDYPSSHWAHSYPFPPSYSENVEPEVTRTRHGGYPQAGHDTSQFLGDLDDSAVLVPTASHPSEGLEEEVYSETTPKAVGGYGSDNQGFSHC